jgi:hypothetical protein
MKHAEAICADERSALCERLTRSSDCKLEIIPPLPPYQNAYSYPFHATTLDAELSEARVKTETLLRRRVTWVLLIVGMYTNRA